MRGGTSRPTTRSFRAGPSPVDVTEIDVPFHRAGGGVVSTPGEIAKMLRALLGGDFLPGHLRAEMLQAVDSDWAETDRYGLGIGEITALMGRQQSPCGPAWGHIGFAVGYTAMALSSEDGNRQVVLCANGSAAYPRGRGELLGHRRPPRLAPVLHVTSPHPGSVLKGHS